MKTPLRALGLLLVSAVALAAADVPAPVNSSSSPGPTPQPRARLDRSTPVPVVRVETTPAANATPATKSSEQVLLMDKVTVTDVKVVEPPRMPAAPDPKKFSFFEGGALHRGKIGSLPVAVGIWRYTDIFAEEERFQSDVPSKMLFDLVRIKF